jgi:hypothetical protein
MKPAGHSSVTVSQRYVHPTLESVEFAFGGVNSKALRRTSGTKFPTKSAQRVLHAS